MSAQVPTAPGLHHGLMPSSTNLHKRTIVHPHHAKLPLHEVSNAKLPNGAGAGKTQSNAARSAPLAPRLNGTVYQPTAQSAAPSKSDPAASHAHATARVRAFARPPPSVPSAAPANALEALPAAAPPGVAPMQPNAEELMLEAQAETLRSQFEADQAQRAPTGRQKHSHLSRPPQLSEGQQPVLTTQVEIARALEAATTGETTSASSHAVASDEEPVESDAVSDAYLSDNIDDEDDDVDSVPDDFEFLRTIDPDREVCLPEDLELAAAEKALHVRMRYEWSTIRPRAAAQETERARLLAAQKLSTRVADHEAELAAAGVDPEEARDTTMVAEYTDEILDYLSRCEKRTMANPAYMDHQKEIEWEMRSTLVDWLLQVHARYHMLPETIWIAINILDRFLSLRVVALAKLQLLGVTALFIAAKYEEIMPPSVDEFVFVTEGGCTRDEILKGERIILEALSFNVSGYTSPYPFLRRISKADDYDMHSRTLAKFLMELTLLDHRFLRARPRTVAAMSMFLSRRMLGSAWDGACVYYSGLVEEQLVPAANLVLERLLEPGLGSLFVFHKYTSRRFLRAAAYAREWAGQNHRDVTAAAEAAAAAAAATAAAAVQAPVP